MTGSAPGWYRWAYAYERETMRGRGSAIAPMDDGWGHPSRVAPACWERAVPVSNTNPRFANGNLRRKLRARLKSEGRPCAICSRPIDYALPANDPWSFEADEIVPVSRGGSPFDYGNLQPTHRRCNQLKSNHMPGDERTRRLTVVRSREW